MPVKHGHASGGKLSREYASWSAMIQRCTNPNTWNYQNYGGRGIRVCPWWLHSFESFLSDMGRRPKGKTLDRHPDKNGDYEPGNCRWATPKQQIANRRTYPKGRKSSKGKYWRKGMASRQNLTSNSD